MNASLHPDSPESVIDRLHWDGDAPLTELPVHPVAGHISQRCRTTLSAISDQIRHAGYVVIDDALPMESASRLLYRVKAIRQQGILKTAGIGRREDHMIARDIRQDFIHWLTDDSADRIWSTAMDKLRQHANRELLLGLNDYESHFAYYPPMGGYKKHYDAFRGQSNRILSTVYYLNEQWQPGDGGELAIYNEQDQLLSTVTPVFNRLVVFLSEEFPHEVLPATKERFSIAGWFRLNKGQDLFQTRYR